MSASAPDWLVDLFRKHAVFDDLLVSAYIADDEPERVVILGRDAFLGSDDGYLMLSLANGDGSLQIGSVDRPRLHDALDLDDVRPLFVSLAKNYLSVMFDVRCRAVTLFLNAESDLETGRVRAALFHLSTGPSVFFDPLQWDGIRIGGEFDARTVLAERPDIRTVEISAS